MLFRSKMKGWSVEEYNWGDLTEVDQQESLKRRFNKPPIWRLNSWMTYWFRSLLFSLAGDAIAFNKYKKELTSKLHEMVITAKAEGHEKIVLVGYSLGGWIINEYLHDYNYSSLTKNEYSRISGVLTYGSSIPLYRGEDFKGFVGVPWINMWEKSDILSMPFLVPYIKDIEYKGHVPLISNSIASHLLYNKAPSFKKLFLKHIVKL